MALYQINGLLLSAYLVKGDLEQALKACAALVEFLRATLSHVRNHPLLGLQLFTLADLLLNLERSGQAKAALSEALGILVVAQGGESALCLAAAERTSGL